MSKSTNKTRKASRRGRMQRPLEPAETIQIIGDPTALGAEPTVRAMTLDDIEDDCPICQMMREEILAGNPPQVMVFE
ncbi:MAG: hypothetical protein JHC98_04520 [Thermoleophilaceae bacterium]|nr:hypothetical protein [Thermoleophilaceae bacterium]